MAEIKAGEFGESRQTMPATSGFQVADLSSSSHAAHFRHALVR